MGTTRNELLDVEQERSLAALYNRVSHGAAFMDGLEGAVTFIKWR